MRRNSRKAVPQMVMLQLYELLPDGPGICGLRLYQTAEVCEDCGAFMIWYRERFGLDGLLCPRCGHWGKDIEHLKSIKFANVPIT
jgi:hypothetical protein